MTPVLALKRNLLGLSLVAAAGSAFATGSGSSCNNCPPTPTPTPTGNTTVTVPFNVGVSTNVNPTLNNTTNVHNANTTNVHNANTLANHNNIALQNQQAQHQSQYSLSNSNSVSGIKLGDGALSNTLNFGAGSLSPSSTSLATGGSNHFGAGSLSPTATATGGALNIGGNALSPSATAVGGRGGDGGRADASTNIGAGALSSSAQTGPVSQNIVFEAAKIPKPVVNSAIAPAIFPNGSGGGVVVSSPDNPYATCFREKVGEATYSLALTAPFVSLSGGRAPEKEDNAGCITRVDQVMRDRRLAASGRSGQAAVIRRDLEVDASLKTAVTSGRAAIQKCSWADPVELELTGVCPPAPVAPKEAVSELVFIFINAQGEKTTVRESELAPCPPGTRRNPATLVCERN